MKWPLIDEYINDFEKTSLPGQIYPRKPRKPWVSSWKDSPGSIAEAVLIPPVPTTYAALKERKLYRTCNHGQVIEQIFGPRRTQQSKSRKLQRKPPTFGHVPRVEEEGFQNNQQTWATIEYELVEATTV